MKTSSTKYKRRFCKVSGCNRIVKSQGVCQAHGAKPRTCKVQGCDKQAQGGYQGMCKVHARTLVREGPCQPVAAAVVVPTTSCLVPLMSGSNALSQLENQQQPSTTKKNNNKSTPRVRPRRYCKVEGCHRVTKSKGLCQRHGATPVKCRVETCKSQAQGNCQGMCKRHFREHSLSCHDVPSNTTTKKSPSTATQEALLRYNKEAARVVTTSPMTRANNKRWQQESNQQSDVCQPVLVRRISPSTIDTQEEEQDGVMARDQGISSQDYSEINNASTSWKNHHEGEMNPIIPGPVPSDEVLGDDDASIDGELLQQLIGGFFDAA